MPAQDVILGRKTVGLIRGEVLVNGHPKQQATWSRVCGYVEQQVRWGRAESAGGPPRMQAATLPRSAASATPRPNLPCPAPPRPQDIHSAGTTVREALLFSARLRLEESIGWPQVVGLVDDTLEMV